jgi:hypothetical protein
MKIYFEGVGAVEGRIAVADSEFKRMGRIGCITEVLEDSDCGGELVGRNEKIDVGEISGTQVGVNASQDVGQTFEGNRLNADMVEGGGELPCLGEGSIVTISV